MQSETQTLTDNEWVLMNAVWQQQPITARDVANSINNEKAWAYNTVKTMLDRLVVKQVLAVEKHDRRNHYVALLSQEQARKTAMHSLLDKAFAGAAGSMMHCMLDQQALSAEDRDHLKAMLRQLGEADE